MDLEKILKMLEAGNHFLLIPLTTKLAPLQYLAAENAAKRKGEDLSTYARNAIIVSVDRDGQDPLLMPKIDPPKDLESDLDKMKFMVEAYEKFILANHLEIPTLEQLMNLWVEGKKEVATFGRVKVLVEAKDLPQFLGGTKTQEKAK